MLADYDALVARGVVHVIDHDDGLAGVIVMWSESDHFYIDNIAVDPGRQGHGIGSRLLAHAEGVATSTGHREVRLFTNEAMIDNLTFYPRRGYVESHRQVEGGYHRVYFTRDISDGGVLWGS